MITGINVNTPFLEGVQNSRVSREWLRLLLSLTNGVNNSATTGDTEELQALAYASRTSHLSDLEQRIQELEAKVNSRNRSSQLESADSNYLTRSASNALNCTVSDDTTTNLSFFPVFVSGIAGEHRLVTSGANWFYNPSTGTATAKQLVATTGFGCNGKSAQVAYVSGGAAPAGGIGTAAGGYDTAVNRDAAITLLNNIRLALIANGIMS